MALIQSPTAYWSFPFPAARIRWLCAFALSVFALSVAKAAEPTRFEVRSAYIEPSAGVYQLNATVDFELPEGAREAVRQGAPLTLLVDIVVKRRRNYWLDETIAALEQRYELVYHAVSERYLLRNLNSGEQVSFPTLAAALDALRVMSHLPILDQALINPRSRHEISVRATLDVVTIPDALRFVLFWKEDWGQRTEWYTWSPQL